MTRALDIINTDVHLVQTRPCIGRRHSNVTHSQMAAFDALDHLLAANAMSLVDVYDGNLHRMCLSRARAEFCSSVSHLKKKCR